MDAEKCIWPKKSDSNPTPYGTREANFEPAQPPTANRLEMPSD